jgi:hypothetical protein
MVDASIFVSKHIPFAEMKRQLGWLKEDLVDASIITIDRLEREMVAKMDREQWPTSINGDSETTYRTIVLAMIAERKAELLEEIPVDEPDDQSQ